MAEINKAIVTGLSKLSDEQQESVKLWIYNRHFKGFSTVEKTKE